jgi:hypothetical protein
MYHRRIEKMKKNIEVSRIKGIYELPDNKKEVIELIRFGAHCGEFCPCFDVLVNGVLVGCVSLDQIREMVVKKLEPRVPTKMEAKT